MKNLSKFTPQGFGSYLINPDATIVGRHGWRGNSEWVVKPVLDRYGYLAVRMTENGSRRKWKLHKLICEVFHGPKPGPNFQVCHIDGNKLNNHAENLRWGTAKDNALDRSAHNKTSRGTRHAKSIADGIARSKMNANLIAAAPEMYEFLEELSKNADAPEDNELSARLFALLAKARGESC